MVSKAQIQQAIQAASNAGVASGYAQALEDVAANFSNQIARWQAEVETKPEEERDVCSELIAISCYEATLTELRPELDRRKLEAKSRQSIAESCMLEIGASPFRAARLALAKALGGAARRLAAT